MDTFLSAPARYVEWSVGLGVDQSTDAKKALCA